MRKYLPVLLTLLALSACASSEPRIIQPTADAPFITLSVGMATQVQMPDAGRVQNATVGNPDLVTATLDNDVVNLVAKTPGETNLIIRSREGDGDIKIYQYHVQIENH
jgi:hypothetical protein